MAERKYLPTLSDLIDRLSIVQLKAIFNPAQRDSYRAEIVLIEHDIDVILEHAAIKLSAADLRAIMIIMLSNRYIWENEAKVRESGEGYERLRTTHSINGIRNQAKNKIAVSMGERQDWKVDCLAQDLDEEHGNWRVFE